MSFTSTSDIQQKTSGDTTYSWEANKVIQAINQNALNSEELIPSINLQKKYSPPDGYISLTSITNQDVSISLTIGDGATGMCYTVNGGDPIYELAAGGTALLTIPSNNGAPVEILAWSATSVSSGVVGNIKNFSSHDGGLTRLDITKCKNLNNFYLINSPEITELDLSQNEVGFWNVVVRGCSNLSKFSPPAGFGWGEFDLLPVTELDFSGSGSWDQLTLENMPNLTSLNISNRSAYWGTRIRDNPNLSEIIAENTQFSYHASVTSSYYMTSLVNTAMTTDSLYNMFYGMNSAGGSTAWVNIQGTPADGGTELAEGDQYSAEQLQLLVDQKGYTLIL